MNRVIAYLLSILVLAGLVPIVSVGASVGGVQIISPVNGQSFTAGQKLVLTVNATAYAGQVATVYVYNPGNAIVYTNNFQIPANGLLNATLFPWPNTTSGKFPVGYYTIVVLVGSQAAASVQVYWAPGVANVVVTVVNGLTGVPIPNVPVVATNSTSSALVSSGVTNASGMVTLQVPAAPGVTATFRVVASPQGYSPQGTLVTVTGPGTYYVTLKVYPGTLVLTPVSVYVNGVPAGSQPTSVTALAGASLSVVVQASYRGSPVGGAAISGVLYIGNSTVTGSVTSLGNGLYNVTFNVPNAAVPTSGQIVIKGTYEGSSAQVALPVSVMPNYGVQISSLNASLATLGKQLASLTQSLQSLNSTLSSTQAKISSLSSQMAALNSSISTLNSQISQLSSQVSSLSSELKSSQGLMYAGLIVGIIALIIAIVALILVLRKIS
ncbi:MAG: hypothetical protein ACP5HQ_00335 [Thermoprotei archaeon]